MQHTSGSPQQFCLRWNNYQSNLTNVFDQLLQSESFVDVTLACDGHSVKAHKMVLSACSPYFQSLFFENPCQHPIVIMRDIKWPELKAAVEFMYKGEINVSQEQIGPLLKVAESLKIRGLADVNGEQDIVAPTGELTTSTRTLLKTASTPNNGSGEWECRPEGDGPPRVKKRRRPSGERSSLSSPAESASTEIPDPPPSVEMSPAPSATPLPSSVSNEPLPLTLPLPQQPQVSHASSDDMEIKPGIAEMIREEERAKLLESSHAWLGASTSSIAADSYQYQLQSMWQKCWNTNQSLVHNLRFRERGPLKSWRPETMAEAIFSVLKEGLSLSQAARKYDIPYPTFVLYANRVHNMLGPSADGGSDLRPKGRGRPQRILLGVWPDEHIRGVIRAVVFRDSHQIKDEPHVAYPRIHDGVSIHSYPNNSCSNGSEANVSPGAAAAAAVAAVAQGLRQQMCSMVAAAQHQSSAHDTNPVASLVNSLALAGHCGNVSMSSNGAAAPMGPLRSMSSPAGSIQDLRISPAESALESPISSPLGLTVSSSLEPAINLNIGNSMDVGMGMTYKPTRAFASPRPENLFQEDIDELVKPMSTPRPKDAMATIKMEPMAECRGE
ncbi:protein bric-a-brac 1 isoform X3 [Tribolium castaneum]|uniref:protein bric-a-brac 1 isoform X3 n=1 Tax=Tribolium castaneum TaxID=7070 RepID=UPI00077DE5F7|nr:PREDICTED: protein bric-a-brac 1-like isoform X3 [Tribolium castaneum]|eukprot:XP_008192281.2 PREDICTED: protein bric-a-brac 1-like isoform X3 [Tribolium castaneum]